MRVLIAGGLGFVGGHVGSAFVADGHEVTVIDGCLPDTGGGEGLWDDLEAHKIIRQRVEDIQDLPEHLVAADLIVDAMGWTRHMMALKNPSYDMDLNLKAHIHLMNALPAERPQKIIYLGSRGQYGNPKTEVIDEDTPQIPEDVQGIHKVAAESHWRQLSRRHGHTVVSLRFGNSYGVRQPMEGPDIGLLGGFIRALLNGESLELFGKGRTRPFINVKDVACAVLCCGKQEFSGFTALNMATEDVLLEDVLDYLIEQIGQGEYSVVPFPKEEKTMDVGNAKFSGDRFRSLFPDFKMTNIKDGLLATLTYIKQHG